MKVKLFPDGKHTNDLKRIWLMLSFFIFSLLSAVIIGDNDTKNMWRDSIVTQFKWLRSKRKDLKKTSRSADAVCDVTCMR